MKKMVVLDANLLVLLAVGLADKSYIAKHKRLKTFTVEDFDLLSFTIEKSAGVIVTPNALSEASNFLRQIAEPALTRISQAFQLLIQRTEERYIASAQASQRIEFLRLGLADSALLEISRENIVLLSVDANLCIAAQRNGYEALNFNHIRLL